MSRAAATLLLAALLISPAVAMAQPSKPAAPEAPETQPTQHRDSGHRFGVDIAPYTSWSEVTGRVQDFGGYRHKVEHERLALSIALHWEYNPIPYIGVGFKVDIELPVDKPSYLMVLPTAALRGILPLMESKLELFIMGQVGATYLQYADFVGYGWAVSAELGAGYRLTRRWGVQIHGGFRMQEAKSGDQSQGTDQDLTKVGAQASAGFFYLL